MSPAALYVTTVPITLEAFLVPFAEHFRAEGWSVDALANGAAEDAHIEAAFDRRFDIGWSRRPLDPRNIAGSPRRVRQVVAAGGYDLVHVHTPVAAFVTRFALRRRRGRPAIVYTAHGFHFYEGQKALPHAVYRSLERLAARWTDFLVTVNREDFEAARALPGIPPDRVRLIPGVGVDAARFEGQGAASSAEVRAGLGVAADAFVLTTVAELAPVKRHALLLDALARVRERRVVLVLVGDGPLGPELRRRAEELGVGDRVRFAGYRRDVPAVLVASDALALVSEREGLARSVLEAMAAGLPVIGTDTRGIADAVGSDGGWIVPKEDAAALAAAIDAAAGDPAEARRRGEAGRRRALAEFALPRIVRQYEELYREALA